MIRNIRQNKKCENCGNYINVLYGSGRFCCEKCARSYSTKNDNVL